MGAPLDEATFVDLFCCQGAATKGYGDAGLKVIAGVDFMPQPRYADQGWMVIQQDALEWLRANKEWIRKHVKLIHCSPPCQGYSITQQIQGNDHPLLIEPLREILEEIGVPYVIENVEEARWAMKNPVTLCGAMFPGLHTYRHRLFETGNGFVLQQPEEPKHLHKTVKMGRRLQPGDWYHAVGHFSGTEYIREDMGVPWMTREGIRECIPPVYTKYVGEAFLAHLRESGS